MTEIERFIYLPIRLNYPLPGMLKDLMHRVVARAKCQHQVSGMVNEVATGFKDWENELLGMGMGREQLAHAFVRTIAIAIPDLFVVAYDRNAFGSYQLDEAERKVLDGSREDFNAKLAVAEAFARVSGKVFDTADIIREAPIFKAYGIEAERTRGRGIRTISY